MVTEEIRQLTIFDHGQGRKPASSFLDHGYGRNPASKNDNYRERFEPDDNPCVLNPPPVHPNSKPPPKKNVET